MRATPSQRQRMLGRAVILGWCLSAVTNVAGTFILFASGRDDFARLLGLLVLLSLLGLAIRFHHQQQVQPPREEPG